MSAKSTKSKSRGKGGLVESVSSIRRKGGGVTVVRGEKAPPTAKAGGASLVVRAHKAAARKLATGVNAPFDKAMIEAARGIVAAYQIVLACEDGEWYGHALEMPDVMADGSTPDKCVAATGEALIVAVATMLEAGHRPPAAARQGARTQQVNVRLTVEERAILEATAKANGFRGLSDFIRAGALAFMK